MQSVRRADHAHGAAGLTSAVSIENLMSRSPEIPFCVMQMIALSHFSCHPVTIEIHGRTGLR